MLIISKQKALYNAKYSKVGDDQHVVRRCRWQAIVWEGDEPTGVLRDAWELRAGEMYTSLNCLEHSDEHKAVRLGNIAALHHAKTKSGKKISARNALAIIKSGRVRELGRVHSKPLEMKHAGKDDDPSYVKMTGLPADNSDILLLDALAAECSQDFCLFRDIDQSGAFSW